MLRIGLLLLVLPALLLMGLFFVEQMHISDCAQAGGYWNYLQGQCDLQQQHPFIPLMVRRPLLVNGGMLLSCLGLLLTIAGLYRRRR
jgi:hypothetical protein